ncbi:BEM_HP_G0140610.mRNA.1.CDS.1 [Saccharomyces cerevisiae]|nr:BEM_HP_G0140610.mRNA.1.CDS.1 [Saccharomyces cerevisiae]CAI6573274.1 BEM_HP_G0140610.mRNA.1.CDS.1 [Saccharomyces cerevisiae]
MLISLPTRNKSYFRIRKRTYQIGLYHSDSSPIRDISVLNLLIATLCTIFFSNFFFVE